MYDPSKHVVHSENGKLAGASPRATTSRDDIRRMIAAALAAGADPELIVHFHGGLVDKKAALEIAERLWPTYAGAARYPIFFVWEAGLIESIRNNFKDIGNDKLFQQLVKKVSRWVLKQIPAGVGLKGEGGNTDEGRLEKEFDQYFAGTRSELPTALQKSSAASPSLKSVRATASEAVLADEIQADLEMDATFKKELSTIHNDISPADVADPQRKGNGLGATVSKRTEISPQKVDEVFDISSRERGVFTVATAAIFIAKVVVAVVRRYRAGRAHGSYTTIVEEILARAYIDKIGGVVWQQMKKDTADSFTDPATSAGAALLAEIASQQAAGNKKFKRIILVGHSTGAVFISNLIDASARLLPDASFDVVLLAPAVTYKKLAATLNNHGARIHKIRRFGMRDEVEVEDVLVPIVYPRSLLYFVSGLMEFSDDEPTERVADTPLVGMQRFSVNPATFTEQDHPDIAAVEKFIGNRTGSIWSVTEAAALAGLKSGSRKHGDFDNDPDTIASLVQIADKGF